MMVTVTNQLSVPEIACYSRETVPQTGEIVIVYAYREPRVSLWQGVMIVRNGDDTTEAHSGPQPTPQGAMQAVAAMPPAPQTYQSDTLGRVTIPG